MTIALTTKCLGNQAKSGGPSVLTYHAVPIVKSEFKKTILEIMYPLKISISIFYNKDANFESFEKCYYRIFGNFHAQTMVSQDSLFSAYIVLTCLVTVARNSMRWTVDNFIYFYFKLLEACTKFVLLLYYFRMLSFISLVQNFRCEVKNYSEC